MNKKVKLLEEIAKNTPALIGGIALTPIAFPYAIIGGFFNSCASPVDGYAADCVEDFLENDRLLRAWRYGFSRMGKAIMEYRTR